MVRKSLVAVPCLIALAALACGGRSNSTDVRAGDTPAARQPSVTSTRSTTDFGVEACDEYVRQYATCVDTKAPAAIRAQMHQALERAKATWRTAAATPAGRQGLANACSQALESAKAAMQMYGCEP
jgi:hypothetical protein